MLTLGGNSGHARSWIYVGGLLLFLAELNLKFSNYDLSTTLLPQMTTYEFISIAQAVFPAYLNGCRTIGSFLHYDLLHDNFQVSIALLQSNQAILNGLRDIHIEVQGLQRQSGGKALKSVQGLSHKRSKLEKTKAAVVEDDESEEKPSKEAKKLQQATAAIQDPPKGRIPSFVYAIGAYFVFYYFFG